MTGKIFINYRRGDEPGFTHALLGRLEQAFPAERLFIDVDNIPPGEDFVHALESQVAQCDALLAVIGNGWLDARDERGSRRLDDPSDFVRIEIESALKQGKRVIPVLVHEARMPRPDELPEAIRPLATRNAVRLTHERFRADVQGLIKALQGALAEVGSLGPDAIGAIKTRKPWQRSRSAMLTVCVLGVVLAGSAGVWFAKPHMTPLSQETTSVRPTTAPVQPALPIPAETTLAPVPPEASPIQSMTASAQAPVTPVQPASSIVEPPSSPGNAAEVPGSSNAASLEVEFWNSIKDAKDPQLFEAYLKRYPNGAFVDIAKINLEQFKIAVAKPIDAAPEDRTAISDPGLLREVRDRLYELNFDPGSPDANGLKSAILEFETQSKLAQTGEVTQGLLMRLREIGGLKPWGAIVYDKSAGKWGMAWDQASRKEAVASAQSQCGTAQCGAEVSFFGIACGAFATSAANWAMASRDNIQDARQAALDGCGKSGKACRIVGASCADGAGRTTPGN
jgi:Domain of unknown function (DUF4189)/TIR domain